MLSRHGGLAITAEQRLEPLLSQPTSAGMPTTGVPRPPSSHAEWRSRLVPAKPSPEPRSPSTPGTAVGLGHRPAVQPSLLEPPRFTPPAPSRHPTAQRSSHGIASAPSTALRRSPASPSSKQPTKPPHTFAPTGALHGSLWAYAAVRFRPAPLPVRFAGRGTVGRGRGCCRSASSRSSSRGTTSARSRRVAMTTTRGAVSRRGAGPVGPGRCCGSAGEVDEDGFIALMEGRDPGTGRAAEAGGRPFEGGGL